MYILKKVKRTSKLSSIIYSPTIVLDTECYCVEILKPSLDVHSHINSRRRKVLFHPFQVFVLGALQDTHQDLMVTQKWFETPISSPFKHDIIVYSLKKKGYNKLAPSENLPIQYIDKGCTNEPSCELIYKWNVTLTSLLTSFLLLFASDFAPLIFIPSENKRCNKMQMNQMSI